MVFSLILLKLCICIIAGSDGKLKLKFLENVPKKEKDVKTKDLIVLSFTSLI